MKKLIITILILSASIAYGAENLYEYYAERGQSLPSISDRANVYGTYFKGLYSGTAEQNTNLLQKLQGGEMFGAFRPSNYTGKLLTRLDEGGSETTFNTYPGTAADGTSLTTAKIGDFVVFTINPGASNEEKISASAVSVSGTTATWTIINRGLSYTENAAVTANKKAHAIGETVIISNDDHYLTTQYLDIDSASTISGQKTFSQGILFSVAASSTDECTETTEYCTKNYIDSTANAGAATSTESVGGISELATEVEVASSTPTTANKPLVIQAQNATSTPAYSCDASGTTGALCIPVAENDGKLSQSWLDLTESYSWTGTNTFGTATTTFNATTSIAASSNNPLLLNSIDYAFPSAEGASSTVMTTNGSGTLLWTPLDWQLLGEQTLTAAAATSTVTVPARKNYKILFEGAFSANADLNLTFNDDTGSNYGFANCDSAYRDTRACFSVASTTQIKMGTTTSGTADWLFVDLTVSNPSTRGKMVTGTMSTQNGSVGASVSTGVFQIGGVYNTSTQITKIEFTSALSTVTLTAGTRLVVYGSRD